MHDWIYKKKGKGMDVVYLTLFLYILHIVIELTQKKVGDMQDYSSLVESISRHVQQRRCRIDTKVGDMHETTPTNRIDYTIGKPYLDQLFQLTRETSVAAYEEEEEGTLFGYTIADVYRVIVKINGDANGNLPGGEGYLSGKIYLFDDVDEYAYVYKQDGHNGQHVKGKTELLLTAKSLSLPNKCEIPLGDHKPIENHFVDCSDSAGLFVDLLISTSSNHQLTDCRIPSYHKQLPFNSDGFREIDYDKDNDVSDDELNDFEKGKYVRITNLKGCFNKNGRFKHYNFKGKGINITDETVDKFSRYKLKSMDGMCSVTIMYGVFESAILAHVEVVWLGGPNKATTGVYGLIAAKADLSNDDILEKKKKKERNYDAYETILFRKKGSSQSVEAISGKAIELSRSLMAVPVDKKLVIRAHLRCKRKLFPAAKLTFFAEQSGTYELSVEDIFMVKVTWSQFY